jgi:hypothetical protein
MLTDPALPSVSVSVSFTAVHGGSEQAKANGRAHGRPPMNAGERFHTEPSKAPTQLERVLVAEGLSRRRAVVMSDPDVRLPGVKTPTAPDSGDEEHAVIAHFRLAGDGFGDADQRELVYEAEEVMATAVEEAGAGEVDGNEFGRGEAVVYAYGPDADVLFKVMEPTLRGLPFRPAHVFLRRGDSEARVEL